MQKVLAIAANTIIEARRNKVFYAIFFFALVIIVNSFVFTGMTIATHDRILRDAGTTAMDLFGVLLAIFLGIGLVSREVDRKTVYTVVTKPVRRASFILGKFTGLMGILAVTLGVMFACLVGVLYASSTDDPVPLGTLFWYLGLRMIELAVVISFAILMSTFSTAPMSAFATVGVYVIGHLSPDLHFFGSRSESPLVRALAAGFYYVFPNLEHFNVSKELSYLHPVDPGTGALSIAFGLAYAAAFLMAAMVIFERRDFR